MVWAFEKVAVSRLRVEAAFPHANPFAVILKKDIVLFRFVCLVFARIRLASLQLFQKPMRCANKKSVFIPAAFLLLPF